MRSGIILILSCLLFFVSACTLSGEQEERLNKQLGRYIAAHNDGRLLELIGLTHPAVVKHYKQQGDSLFIEHFREMPDSAKTYFEDPTYRDMKDKGKLIQRKYWVDYYTADAEISREYCIFALSDDGGDNWLFMRQEDYLDPGIKGVERLLR